jgi:hypothetical protein
LARGRVNDFDPVPRTRLFIPNPQFLAPNNVYLRRTLISPEEIRKCQTKSGSKRWKGGSKVKFTCQELPRDGAFITAQLEGSKVVYSIVLTNAGNPLSRKDVESHFDDELSKK